MLFLLGCRVRPRGETLRCTFVRTALVSLRPDKMAAFTVSMSALVGAPVKVRRIARARAQFVPSSVVGTSPAPQGFHGRSGEKASGERRAETTRRENRERSTRARHATGARAHSSLAILAARESGEAARRSQTARAARDVIAVPASLIRGWLGLFPTFADAREGLAAPWARAPSRRATPASSSEFDHTRAHRIRRPAPRPRARSPRRTSR